MFVIKKHLPSFFAESFNEDCLAEHECTSLEQMARIIRQPLKKLCIWNNQIILVEKDNLSWKVMAVVIRGLDHVALPKVIRVLPPKIRYTIKHEGLTWPSLPEDKAKDVFWGLRDKTKVKVIREELPKKLLIASK